MNAITTRNLTHRFGKSTVLDNLNLQVPVGSLYGLIGPNGAGKTTTLRILAGLLEPSYGEIRINELRLSQFMQEAQRQIGFMPDFFGVYDDLLVWEYLDFFARCYKLSPKQRQRVTSELLELVELGEKRNEPVQSLSRGMRQRLCLAHALVHDPQVLLLDEPASGLDPRARVEMRALLLELRHMGKTLLVSSHILGELGEMCDGLAILECGRLIACGSMSEIRQSVSPIRRLEIRFLSDNSQITKLLEHHKQVNEIISDRQKNRLEISFSGNDDNLAELIEMLVQEKIRLVAIREIEYGLEETFLSMTKGELNQ